MSLACGLGRWGLGVGTEAAWGPSMGQQEQVPQEVWPLLLSRAWGCPEPLSQREGEAPAWSMTFTSPGLVYFVCQLPHLPGLP